MSKPHGRYLIPFTMYEVPSKSAARTIPQNDTKMLATPKNLFENHFLGKIREKLYRRAVVPTAPPKASLLKRRDDCFESGNSDKNALIIHTSVLNAKTKKILLTVPFLL